MHPSSRKAFGALALTLAFVRPGLAGPTPVEIGPTGDRMEKGAFLRSHAYSRAQLLTQVRRDPVVAARYARHFGMSDRELVRYFGTLRTSTLPETRRYVVWHINPDGTIGSRNLLLKQGTAVFRDSTGRIALKESCGNPMIDSRTARADLPAESRLASTAPATSATDAAPVQAPEVLATTPDAVAAPVVAAVTPPAAPPVVVAPPVESPVIAAPPVVAESGAAAPQAMIPIATGGGGPNLLPLLAIPLVGVGVASASGGGGGGNVVPEPATITAMVTCVGLIAARRRKKN